jgi:hypothetical protein
MFSRFFNKINKISITTGERNEKWKNIDTPDQISLLLFPSKRYGSVPNKNIWAAQLNLKPLIFHIGLNSAKDNRYRMTMPVSFSLVLSRTYQIFLE